LLPAFWIEQRRPCKSLYNNALWFVLFLRIAPKYAPTWRNSSKRQTSADTTALEREIDRLVYELYELTPEEIAIVEGTK
jgi:hypothetical protein